MFYAEVSLLKPPVFKRLTGVSPDTFTAMSAALEKHLPAFGRPPKLCREDRLLMTLMYWREYRTYVHIAQTYGLSLWPERVRCLPHHPRHRRCSCTLR